MREPELADTTDTRWEEDSPAYRVQVWTVRASNSLDLAEYQFDGVDVDEVLQWASSQEAPDRQIVVYARIIKDYEPGLIRLRGTDPSISD
ncbi:hypothetical protein [Arthrobacter sp. H14]|uniref:hypothetical protein n=1 Tax=Arthrobacter sp. H14 TaxID=1312959 RepID=UPI00047AA92B|nr:hypothetical protein [Arthrobacter sp. H14]